MSKLRLFFLLIFDGGGGYLSGEDAGDDGVVLGDGGYLLGEDVRGGSDNEKIFLLYKEEEKE